MNATTPCDPSVSSSSIAKFPFALAIGYQGASSCSRAGRLYDRLLEQLRADCDFQTSWWSLDKLFDSDFREQAAAAAAQADMIILSLASGQSLDPDTQSWIETWLAQKPDCHSALVALVHAPPCVNGFPVRAYLKAVAQVGKMDFFFHSADSTPEVPYSMHAISHRAHSLTPVMLESLAPRFPPARMNLSA